MNTSHPENDPLQNYEDVSTEPVAPTGWLATSSLPQAASGKRPAPRFELRPLTAGEVLDRTFAVYRSRFWLFAGIGGIAGAARTILTAVQMLTGHFMRPVTLARRFDVTGIVLAFVVGIVSFFFLSLGLAATTYAVGEVYLGHEVSVGSSWKKVGPRWLGYTGIFLWQAGSFLWIPLLTVVPGLIVLVLASRGGGGGNVALIGVAAIVMVLGGFGGLIGGTFLLLRNLLAVPAAVIEGLKVRAAMRRSKTLSVGAKGRIFLVGIIYYCLISVVGVIQVPFAMMMVFAIQKGQEAIGSQIGTLLVGFVGSSLVMPVFMIGLTIIYLDQRVRKEALDIELMLEATPLAAGVPPVVAAPAVDVYPTDTAQG